MAKRGRRRNATVPREKNGRASRVGQTPPIMNRELLTQRAAAVGVVLNEKREKTLRDQRVGTALGVLWARHTEGKAGLDERQYRAGEALGALWRRWAGMVAAPPRTALRSEGGCHSVDPKEDAWRRTDAEFKSIRMEVWALPAGVPAWRLLERVIMDDTLPAALDNPNVLEAVQRALDRVAQHFRIPVARAA